MIAQVHSLKHLYQYALVPANIFYDFLGGICNGYFSRKESHSI